MASKTTAGHLPSWIARLGIWGPAPRGLKSHSDLPPSRPQRFAEQGNTSAFERLPFCVLRLQPRRFDRQARSGMPFDILTRRCSPVSRGRNKNPTAASPTRGKSAPCARRSVESVAARSTAAPRAHPPRCLPDGGPEHLPAPPTCVCPPCSKKTSFNPFFP